MKAGIAAREEPSVETSLERDDFSKDRHRNLLRRVGADRQPHGAADPCPGPVVRNAVREQRPAEFPEA
jgi:hypothetical protein